MTEEMGKTEGMASVPFTLLPGFPDEGHKIAYSVLKQTALFRSQKRCY